MNVSRVLRRKENELQEMEENQSKQTEISKFSESRWEEAVKQEDKEAEQEVETTSKLDINPVPDQKEIDVMQGLSSVEEHRHVEDEPVIVDMPLNIPVGLSGAASRRRSIRSMTWARGKSAPEKLRRGVSVVHGSKAYFRPANSVKVYCYDNIVGIQHWSLLPENPNTNCSLVVVDDILTSIGGIGYNHSTNTLLSLVNGKKEEKEWHKKYPHMTIPRYGAACIATEKALVVAGGLTADEGLNTVEVMRTDTKQWSIVCSLPRKCCWMSPAILGDTLYLAGGFVGDKPSNNAFSCSVSNLLSSSTIGSKILWSFSSSLGVWKEVSHLPVTRSTLASFGGDLLAIGGEDGSEKPTTAIHGYDSNTDSWIRVSQMKDRRSWCLAVYLPETGLVVVGGFTGIIDDISSGVEILN